MKKRYLHGKYSSGQLCLMAVFIAIGLVLQYIEGTFAIFAPPGAKVGLANVVSIISLFMFGGANAFVIAVIRAVTGSLLGSGAAAVAYSTAGAAAAVDRRYFGLLRETVRTERAFLEDALRRAGATLGDEAPTHRSGGITKATLYELGLSGRPDSARRRRELLKRLGLPERLGANALLDVLNALYTSEELRALTAAAPLS